MGPSSVRPLQLDNKNDCRPELEKLLGLNQVRDMILANPTKYELPCPNGYIQKPRVDTCYNSHPRIVRDHLDPRILEDILTRLRGTDSPPATKGHTLWQEPGANKLFTLTFCAMELGCRLPAWYRKELQLNYTRFELPTNDKPQIERALDLYRNGVPYNFLSAGIVHAVDTSYGVGSAEEATYNALEDVPAGEEITLGNTELRPLVYDFNHPVDGCGNCGARESFPGGEKLKRCAGCKKRLYCSENCLKFHWGLSHHRVCKSPDQY